MGLLSSRNLVNIGIGAAKGTIAIIDEAKATAAMDLDALAKAKDEVNTLSKTKQEEYNNALRVTNSVGGGAFGVYMFETMGAKQISNLSKLSPTDLDNQLKQIKFSFENLPQEQSAIYKEGSYSDIAKSNYNKDIDALKLEKGLVKNNNLGDNTAKTFSGFVTQGVKKTTGEKEDKILGQVAVPEIGVDTSVVGGGYGSIGQTAFEDSRIKLSIDQDYVDGTLRQDMLNKDFTLSNNSKALQEAMDKEYALRISNAQTIFMTNQGDVPPVNTDIETEITNENINDILG